MPPETFTSHGDLCRSVGRKFQKLPNDKSGT